MLSRRAFTASLASSLGGLASCAVPRGPQYLALPQVSRDPAAPLVLRVAYVENPGQMRFSKGLLERLLAQTVVQVRLHLGLEIRFSTLDTLQISEVFGRFSVSARQRLQAQVFDIRAATPATRKRFFESLQRALEAELRGGGNTLASLIDYAKPQLAVPLAAATLAGLTEAVGETHILRLRAALYAECGARAPLDRSTNRPRPASRVLLQAVIKLQ